MNSLMLTQLQSMMANDISRAVFVFLWLYEGQLLSLQADSSSRLTRQKTSPVNTTAFLPCIKPQQFFFQGNRESYLTFHTSRRMGKDGSCINILQVPEGKFISLTISQFNGQQCNRKTIDIEVSSPVTGSRMSTRGKITILPCDKETRFHSTTNQAEVKFYYAKGLPNLRLTIKVTPTDRNFLHVLFLSHQTELSGVVMPYGFNGFINYAAWLLAETYLTPPPGYSVMLSFPHFHTADYVGCFKRRVWFMQIKNKFNKNLCRFHWIRCGTLQLPAEVYYPSGSSSKFCLSFQSQNEKGFSGFKIRFSYNRMHELPELVFQTSNTNIFNCSVPFYAKFHQHLDCNLETECLQAEDEASCPYSRGVCPLGYLNAGSRCYKYIRTMKIMTWYDASEVCLKQGLTLANIPTQKQMQAFRDNILLFAPTPFKVFIGMRTSDPSLPTVYREVWQSSNGIMAYYFRIKEKLFKLKCSAFAALVRDKLSTNACGFYEYMQYIFCEGDALVMPNKSTEIRLPSLEVNSTFGRKESTRFVTCPEGHVMHDFLSCDQMSRCEAEVGMTSCVTHNLIKPNATDSQIVILMYFCDSQSQTIHYTQVCDHQAHCIDSSDESFCIHHACMEKQCSNGQCVTAAQWCDGMTHCSDRSDETCYQVVTRNTKKLKPAIFDGHGKYSYGRRFPDCPRTHFLCPDRELCIPVYLRCNGVYDCSDKADENTYDDVRCPGYYRCRGTKVCVHSDHVCDGVFQCPQQDDELLCHLTCPDHCRCQGLAFVCPRPFSVHVHSDIRYLDSFQSGVKPEQLFHIQYLIRLSLASCGLYDLPVLDFPNLKFLDLGNNKLKNISTHVFMRLSNLHYVTLSRNPLEKAISSQLKTLLKNVHTLDLSHSELRYFESEAFSNFQYIKELNLSKSMLTVISSNGFGPLTGIESLDLRGTKLKKYPIKMLQSLTSLRVLYTDVYMLCCQDVLPRQMNRQNCHSAPDETASCKDLLQSDVYRLFLWITCIVALIGNIGSFISRLYMQRRKPSNSFSVFIAHLNVADFSMGLYLAMVGSADQVFRGRYLWHAETWKTGVGCKIAGFFSLLSSEMSAFIICFITLDRFLVIHFPFSQLRFRSTSAHVVCMLSCGICVALAALPLVPLTEHWEFYSQTDLCIPLPISRREFQGRLYSFGILIVLNFILFVMIAVGQVFVYMSIRKNAMAIHHKNTREAIVARRLLIVVMTDFLCWFPIGLLGLLAANGVSIPSEVNVAVAVFALPLNSALNHFLYTLNLVMEKRQKASERRLLKFLQLKYGAG